ncbi:hypothetical protein D3C86_2204940 [compost metagenome]
MAGTGAMTVAVTAVMTVGGIVTPTVATVAAETVTRIDATASDFAVDTKPYKTLKRRGQLSQPAAVTRGNQL